MRAEDYLRSLKRTVQRLFDGASEDLDSGGLLLGYNDGTYEMEKPETDLQTKATEMLRRRRDLEIKAERLRQERLHGGSGHHREAPGPPSVAVDSFRIT